MTPTEAYEKYKHLDRLLSDRDFLCETFRGGILYDLWQAIKMTTIQPDSLDWMVTEVAKVLEVDRETLAHAIMGVQAQALGAVVDEGAEQ